MGEGGGMMLARRGALGVTCVQTDIRRVRDLAKIIDLDTGPSRSCQRADGWVEAAAIGIDRAAGVKRKFSKRDLG